jgi:hypothetical protein
MSRACKSAGMSPRVSAGQLKGYVSSEWARMGIASVGRRQAVRACRI